MEGFTYDLWTHHVHLCWTWSYCSYWWHSLSNACTYSLNLSLQASDRVLWQILQDRLCSYKFTSDQSQSQSHKFWDQISGLQSDMVLWCTFKQQDDRFPCQQNPLLLARKIPLPWHDASGLQMKVLRLIVFEFELNYAHRSAKSVGKSHV